VILSALFGRVRRSCFNIFACALLVGCTGLDNRAQDPPISPKDLSGAWILETVGGKPPGAVNLKSWRITFSTNQFSTNQQWNYSGEMTERFGGMQVSGSGSWKISSGVLEYTAGANTGRSIPKIRDRTLTLSPDPVVMPDGKTPVVTTYKLET
jgi:hypothetical protein